MRKAPRSSLLAVVAAATVLGACGDHNGPVGPPTNVPGISAISGAGATDTVTARLAAPLVVEVRDSTGELLSGVVVRFDADPVTRPNGAQAYGVALSSATDNGYPWDGSTYSTPSDSRGRAAVTVTMGTVAGPASVKVSVPTFGFVTHVPLKVLAGNVADVVVLPADTGINVGGDATIRAAVADRFGNPRTEPVTVAVHGTAVSGSGATVHGTSYGIAWVVATAGAMVDSSRVVVLPKATLAAIPQYQGSGPSLLIFNSDGTQRNTITAFPQFSAVITPYWAPDGSRLVCVVDGGNLYSVAVGTRTASRIGSGAYPQYSRDGSSILYTAASHIWRMKPDGSDPVQLTPDDPSYALDQIASPDPSGTKLVMWTTRSSSIIAIFDTASKSTTPTAAGGGYARWSPNGDRIAVADGDGLYILDGSGALVEKMPNGGDFWISAAPLDWSPDGQWIIAGGGMLEMIEVATHRVLPVPGTSGYAHPTWKP